MPSKKKPLSLNITTETIINGKLKVTRIVDKTKKKK